MVEDLIDAILKQQGSSRQYGCANIEFHPKVWGGEIWIVNTPFYCSKLLHINPGWSSSLHYHKEKNEAFLLYDGLILMEYHPKEDNPMEWVMERGNIQIINASNIHRFTAFYPSIIHESSTHHDDKDTVRLEFGRQVDLSYLKEKYNIKH